MRDEEPDGSCEEVGIGVARIVIAESIVLSIGHFIEESTVLVGNVNVFQPSLFYNIWSVSELNNEEV